MTISGPLTVYVDRGVAWITDNQGHDQYGVMLQWLIRQLLENGSLGKNEKLVAGLLLRKVYPKETDGSALD